MSDNGTTVSAARIAAHLGHHPAVKRTKQIGDNHVLVDANGGLFTNYNVDVLQSMGWEINGVNTTDGSFFVRKA